MNCKGHNSREGRTVEETHAARLELGLGGFGHTQIEWFSLSYIMRIADSSNETALN